MPRFIIEARNTAYQRIGLIENYTSFDAIVRLNAPGSWTLTLPAGTPEIALLQPGGGIIARIDGQVDVAFSGPITKISHAWDESNQGAGTVTVTGVTDDQLLFERVTYPIPENDLSNQTDDRHIFIGNAQTLMNFLVDENCGPDARPERIYPQLDVAPNEGLGEPAAISTRFDVLGEELQEIANAQGLGFRVRQGNNNERLEFAVFAPQNKQHIIFGKQYGNLQAYSYEIEAPTATRVIFACQGEGKDRYFEESNLGSGVTAKWDDRDDRIIYSEDWNQETDATAYRETLTTTTFAFEELELDFVGTGLRIYGKHQDNPFGSANWRIDGDATGVLYDMGDLPVEVPGTQLLEITGLALGEHHLRWQIFTTLRVDYIEILNEELLGGIDWQRNSERFYDRRDIPVAWDPTHTTLIDPGNSGAPADPAIYRPMLEQAVVEAAGENGPKASLSLTPIDTEVARYGRDYRIGDIVSVDINGQMIVDVLREVRLSDGDDGPRITPVIGDTQASSTPIIYKTIRQLISRVRRLEAR